MHTRSICTTNKIGPKWYVTSKERSWKAPGFLPCSLGSTVFGEVSCCAVQTQRLERPTERHEEPQPPVNRNVSQLGNILQPHQAFRTIALGGRTETWSQNHLDRHAQICDPQKLRYYMAVIWNHCMWSDLLPSNRQLACFSFSNSVRCPQIAFDLFYLKNANKRQRIPPLFHPPEQGVSKFLPLGAR